MSVCAVVGAQFGSEGKGLIVGEIAEQYDHHVRVGAANAGHTLYTTETHDNPPHFSDSQEKHVMQQLPCAAYANPSAQLYIGPGALISEGILSDELDIWRHWRRMRGLPLLLPRIDYRAHVITDAQIQREAATDLAERIGSTSATAREGIGVAQSDRVMRSDACLHAGVVYDIDERVSLADAPMVLRRCRNVLLEGTQGTGLSLTTGYFPYCTSRNTTAAGLCADTGIAPGRLDRVIVVARTYPIRVAGASGPWAPDSEEIAWGDIGVDAESERTTVTKKVRRVATLSMHQLIESVTLNGATEIALTFCDYVDPRIKSSSSKRSGVWRSLLAYPRVAELVHDIEASTGVPVTMLGTGPRSVIHLEKRTA